MHASAAQPHAPSAPTFARPARPRVESRPLYHLGTPSIRHVAASIARLPKTLALYRRLRQSPAYAEVKALAASGAVHVNWHSLKYVVKGGKHLMVAINRALALGLDAQPGRRVLDVSTGVGYFPWVCAALGHEATSTDLPTNDVYNAAISALGVDRSAWRIARGEPVPDLGGPFDAITSFMVCFDTNADGSRWAASDWVPFLSGLVAQLRPGGVLHLSLNRYDDALLGVLEREGYTVDRRSGHVSIRAA